MDKDEKRWKCLGKDARWEIQNPVLTLQEQAQGVEIRDTGKALLGS